MKVLLLGHEEVAALLPVDECIGLMRDALAALAEGQVNQPLRNVMRPHGAAGLLGLMPAYSSAPRPAFGLKAICIFPDNPARGLDSPQGAVLLFSGETGEPLAFVNASAITAVRTG